MTNSTNYAVQQFLALAKATKWYITLSTGTHALTFTSDDSLSYGGDEYTYELIHDTKHDEMSLRISTLEGFLQFQGNFRQREAQFVGRDRTTRSGFGSVSPDKFTSELTDLCHPGKYREPVSAKVPDVQYVEEPGPNYPIPDYDIRSEFPELRKQAHLPAICIIGCDRPDYLKRVVQALARNPQSAKWPIYFFVDKPLDFSDWHKVDQQILEVRRTFNLPHVVRRPVNYGCGRNIIDARIQLFENVGHPRVYMFEDDLVPNPQYITLCENMWKWVKSSGYTDVGAVQCWEWCQLSESCRALHTSYVRATMSNWWGYSMSKECWDAIAPTMKEYWDKFMYGKYSNRPHKTILKWIESKLKNIDFETPNTSEGAYGVQQDYAACVRRYFSGPPTGQDAATMLSMVVAGKVRLATVVNRGEYIGRNGIHMTEAAWRQHGYHLITTREYDTDAELTEFEPQWGIIHDPEISDVVPGMRHVAY